MKLVEKIKKLKELGFTFVYSKTDSIIGDSKFFIPILSKNIDIQELEKICDKVLDENTVNPVFELLENEKMILYV